jgi:hypothetical protein
LAEWANSISDPVMFTGNFCQRKIINLPLPQAVLRYLEKGNFKSATYLVKSGFETVRLEMGQSREASRENEDGES